MQVMDAVFQHDEVPLHKLNFCASNEAEKRKNIELLDTTLQQLGLHHPINVYKMANGNFQSNYTLIQWCLSYMLKEMPGISAEDYPALQRRQHAFRMSRQCRGRQMPKRLL